MDIKIGIIGIPGAWSSEILKEELAKLSNDEQQVSGEIFPVADLHFDIETNQVFIGETNLESYDAIIIKKLGEYNPRILDWLDILGNLEDKGLKFYSSPKKLRNMISRIGCTRQLAAHNIPMPPTLLTENSAEALKWIGERDGAVFKPNFSTKARGMEVLRAGETTIEKLDSLKDEYGLLYLQQLMELPGKDFGVVFSAGEYLGTYARVGDEGSWNTTTADGGHYEVFEPNEEIMGIANKAKDIFGLDFCCVDIAETPQGPIVFEVSAFGGFKGLYEGANINSAAVLVKLVVSEVSK